MSNSVALVLWVQSSMVLSSALLLAQPRLIFRRLSSKTQTIARWGGMFLLGLTFCWSVIVGVVLSMNGMVIRI